MNRINPPRNPPEHGDRHLECELGLEDATDEKRPPALQGSCTGELTSMGATVDKPIDVYLIALRWFWRASLDSRSSTRWIASFTISRSNMPVEIGYD